MMVFLKSHWRQVLEDSGMSKSDVDDVVLVGGSARIPKIEQMFKEFFNGKSGGPSKSTFSQCERWKNSGLFKMFYSALFNFVLNSILF